MCESSGRKEVTRYLIYHELLSLRSAGYITDANTEQWPPPGKVVARNYTVTQSYLLALHAFGWRMHVKRCRNDFLCQTIESMQGRDVSVFKDTEWTL